MSECFKKILVCNQEIRKSEFYINLGIYFLKSSVDIRTLPFAVAGSVARPHGTLLLRRPHFVDGEFAHIARRDAGTLVGELLPVGERHFEAGAGHDAGEEDVLQSDPALFEGGVQQRSHQRPAHHVRGTGHEIRQHLKWKLLRRQEVLGLGVSVGQPRVGQVADDGLFGQRFGSQFFPQRRHVDVHVVVALEQKTAAVAIQVHPIEHGDAFQRQVEVVVDEIGKNHIGLVVVVVGFGLVVFDLDGGQLVGGEVGPAHQEQKPC
jgi:hypothetical protein